MGQHSTPEESTAAKLMDGLAECGHTYYNGVVLTITSMAQTLFPRLDYVLSSCRSLRKWMERIDLNKLRSKASS